MFRILLLPLLTAAVAAAHPAAALPPMAGPVVAAIATPDQPWSPPVDAPVVDPFRPPASPFGPGNRGLEYGTSGGETVRAVADGTVTFARRIGAHRFVVVDHHDGLRSTYAYVDAIMVVRGQRVPRGQAIAVAAPGFHLTARLGDTYVDPSLLFAGARARPRLIPQMVPVPPSIRRFVPVMAPAWRLHT